MSLGCWFDSNAVHPSSLGENDLHHKSGATVAKGRSKGRVLFISGESVIVDDEDFDALRKYHWNEVKGNGQHRYFTTSKQVNGKRIYPRLHRIVAGALPRQIVDHIDGNTLDNRKVNLRITDATGNALNRHRFTVPGMTYLPKRKRWVARIKVNKKLISLGTHRTQEAAQLAYIAAFSRLRPDKTIRQTFSTNLSGGVESRATAQETREPSAGLRENGRTIPEQLLKTAAEQNPNTTATADSGSSAPPAQNFANTEPRPVSTSLAVAKRVEASEGPEWTGHKPLMRNPSADRPSRQAVLPATLLPAFVLTKPEVVSCNSAAPYQRQARESTGNCDRTGRGVLCGSMADSCGGQFISGEKEAATRNHRQGQKFRQLNSATAANH